MDNLTCSDSSINRDNNHSVTLTYYDFTQLTSVRYTLAGVWILIAVVAVLGNATVILVLWYHRSLHNITNRYVLNMAVVDVLIAFILIPLKVVELTNIYDLAPAIFNPLTCSLVQYSLQALLLTNLLTMLAGLMERYVVVVLPTRNTRLSSANYTTGLLLLSWLLPLLTCLPAMMQRPTCHLLSSQWGVMKRHFCVFNFPMYWHRVANYSLSLALNYLAPLLSIAYFSWHILHVVAQPLRSDTPPPGDYLLRPKNINSYMMNIRFNNRLHREINKRKVAKMMVVVSIIYLTSWTPFYAVNAFTMLSYSVWHGHNYFFSQLLTFGFGWIHCVAKPWVYYFMSDRMQLAINHFVRHLLRCRRPPTNYLINYHGCCCCGGLGRRQQGNLNESNEAQESHPAGSALTLPMAQYPSSTTAYSLGSMTTMRTLYGKQVNLPTANLPVYAHDIRTVHLLHRQQMRTTGWS